MNFDVTALFIVNSAVKGQITFLFTSSAMPKITINLYSKQWYVNYTAVFKWLFYFLFQSPYGDIYFDLKLFYLLICNISNCLVTPYLLLLDTRTGYPKTLVASMRLIFCLLKRILYDFYKVISSCRVLSGFISIASLYNWCFYLENWTGYLKSGIYGLTPRNSVFIFLSE